MKVILLILALSCTAFAMPEPDHLERFKRDIAAAKNSCPGKCLMQDKYREWFTQLLPKATQFGKTIAEGGQVPVIPTLPAEKLDTYCTEITAIKTCVSACNDAADAERKTKAEAILEAAKGIVCDADIKAKIPCLQEVAKTPSEACNTQCEQFKAPILEAYNNYKTRAAAAGGTPAPNWENAKTAGKNVCLLVNCRLKCRKTDIEGQCQAEGYTAAKNLAQKMATLAQTAHSQFRPAENFPDECKPDKVVEGA
jgi:hypothetical protein